MDRIHATRDVDIHSIANLQFRALRHDHGPPSGMADLPPTNASEKVSCAYRGISAAGLAVARFEVIRVANSFHHPLSPSFSPWKAPLVNRGCGASRKDYGQHGRCDANKRVLNFNSPSKCSTTDFCTPRARLAFPRLRSLSVSGRRQWATSETFGQSPAELNAFVFLRMELEPQAPDQPNHDGSGKLPTITQISTGMVDRRLEAQVLLQGTAPYRTTANAKTIDPSGPHSSIDPRMRRGTQPASA